MSLNSGISVILLASMLTAFACTPEKVPAGGSLGNSDDGTEEPAVTENLVGTVTDATTGKPIAGVPVTDGYTYTVTDEDGHYSFRGNERTRTVYISVPAAYEIPTDSDNMPAFYKNGKFGDTLQVYTNNFRLTPRTKAVNNFILAVGADSHIYDESNLNRFKKESLPDMISTMESLNGDGSYNECIGLFCGDQMSDNMNMLAPFRQALADKTVNGRKLTFLHCIGNHDFANSILADKEATSYNASGLFVENFGPMDYSLNVGNAHIVVMNNMIVNSKDNWTRDHEIQCIGYKAGFTDEQVEWLKQDLALVEHPEKKVVILCVHVPIFGNSHQNFQTVAQMLTVFNEGHIISGHSHHIKNYIHNRKCRNGRNLYEHNIQAVAGGWWYSNLSTDGSPMGYKVFRFAGNKLFDCVNKATGADRGLQMRVYDGNDTYNGYTAGRGISGTPKHNETFGWDEAYRNHFLVRVWDADAENWTVEFVDKDGNSTPMTRLAGIKDDCTYSFCHNILNTPFGGESAYRVATGNFWAIEAPCGDPAKETGWKIVATHTLPSSKFQIKYECNVLQRDYTGFATGDSFPTNN